MHGLIRTALGLGSVSAISLGLALALVPDDAHACGGMFCDAGPTPMPVDQTGENILFVRDGDTIEAHIQIQYVGEAAQFGWVIPVQSVPELEVGSEPLFRALLAASVPTYSFSTTADQCGNASLSSTAGTGAPSTTDPSTTDPSDGDTDNGGPQVVLTQTVGAFEITVLEGGTGQEVLDWLDMNGYQQDDEALPILDAYLAEGHLFAAVRLTGEAGVEEIHPIVLRFQGTEPCVPLRLTRIAAVDDMGVRSFFLGEGRTVPMNYRHVIVNDLKVNWLSPTNYADVITMAVDEENADGRAFVTEYAGTSNIVQRNGIFDAEWNAEAFADLPVETVGDRLLDQGLLVCDFDLGCTFVHPLLEPLLLEYVTPPADVAAADYWGNQDAWPEVDLSAWDGPAFAALLTTRIIEPGQHADDLLTQHPYLTRMFTRISPAEMTEDPEFHENFALPEVAASRSGQLRLLCNGDGVFTLPDGRELYLPTPTQWPELPDVPNGVNGAMPAAEMIEEVPSAGAPIALTNNTDGIEAVRIAWNAEHGWPGLGADTSGGSLGDSSGESSGGLDGDGSGCGCRAPARTEAPWLLALALLGVRRRRQS
jgi:hypothetical protein